MAKVIRKSNFDHEDSRGDQYFVAQQLNDRQAKAVEEALNALEHEHSDDYYRAVPNDYVLPPDWEP
jgi:hypothetical protein